MTSLQLHLRAHTPSDLPWDGPRERRVLAGALESRKRRARRKTAFELTAAMAICFVIARILPHASAESTELSPNDTDAVVTPMASPPRSLPVGGIAGTGGHGGTGSTGQGGNAGTG